MKKLSYFIFFISCLSSYAQNQEDTQPILPNIAPLSPEAFAFQEYGKVNVNMFVGKPDINVPIYTIKGKEMDLPISLTYDAGGIKVDQLATWVGLGWNLNYGGVVTRRVHHRPDDASVLRVNEETLTALDNNLGGLYKDYDTFSERALVIGAVTKYNQRKIDLEADTFKFNVNGISGTIAIDYNTVLSNGHFRTYCLDQPDVLVSYSGFGTDISSWKITDKNGVQYFFSQNEETYHEVPDTVVEGEYVDAITDTYDSAWYLTRIVSQNKKDTFDFIYTQGQYWSNHKYILPNSSGYTTTTDGHQRFYNPSINANFNKYKIKQFDLAGIKHNNKFIITTNCVADRQDITGRKRLANILIHKAPASVNISFEQSYFTSTATHNLTDEYIKRLKLDAIKFNDTGLNLNYEYKFEYEDENNIPFLLSKGRDYLGYNNGASNNPSLVPGFQSLAPSQAELNAYSAAISSVDREYNLEYTKKGVLKKIYYPTGGNSEFIYELNKTPPIPQQSMTLRNITLVLQAVQLLVIPI